MASLSVSDLGGGRFKVRWREWMTVNGERVQRARSRTVSSKAAAQELQAKILRSIETEGYFEPGARPEACNAEQAAAAWLRHKAARGASPSTIRKYASALQQWWSAVRRGRRLGDTAPVSAELFTRDLFAEVVLAWRGEGLSESEIYTRVRVALDAWTWAFDDPKAYPGIPTPPRDKSSVLPLPPVYVAPEAPTLEEADACLRQLTSYAYVARQAAVVMRFTGLRVSQVLALRVEDLDVARATLRIRTGKSRREAAEQRLVPVSRHLVAELVAELGGRAGGDPLIRRRRDVRAGPNRNHIPGATLSAAWEAATVAGEVRREVWAPRTRKIARPDHAFRAAFQAHLEAEGVRDPVIDFLVGHAPASTRGRHYTPPTLDELRRAVDTLPAIAWGNNLLELRCRAR